MIRALTAVVALGIAGCTVKGYAGPEKPDTEVAAIAISATGDVSIQGVELNGTDLGAIADSVKVLPGEHEITAHYRAVSSSSCSGYNIYCDSTISLGDCSGTVRVQPGRDYLLTVKTNYALVQATFLAKGYFDFSVREDEPDAGVMVCREFDSYDTHRRK